MTTNAPLTVGRPRKGTVAPVDGRVVFLVGLLLWVALGIFLVLLLGCSHRSFTKPRSEIVAESREAGIRLPSIERERALFFAEEEQSRARLQALVQTRASSPLRNIHYRVGAGDEIEINVFDVEELNVQRKVRQSGFITLPLVGALRAAGRTEHDIQDELNRRLAQFVRTPEVSVFVSHYASQTVAVMGAVTNPGSYPLKKGSNSIVELISQAGGISKEAGNFMSFVPAEISGLLGSTEREMRAQFSVQGTRNRQFESASIEIALEDVLGTGGGIPIEIPVRGGDMIVIPEAGQVMVEGEVTKRGAYGLGQRMSLLGALAAAGGITYGAKVDEIEVVRSYGPHRKRRLVVDLQQILTGADQDIRLRNGDLVRVPSHGGRRLRQDTFESLSSLINFGVGGTVNMGGG